MDETNELFMAVNYIKNKVDALERIELLNLRSNRELFDTYANILKSDSMLFDVYKAIDGMKSQTEIASFLNTNDMAISRRIQKLLELGLIEVKEVINNKRIYKHSIAESVFSLTKIKV